MRSISSLTMLALASVSVSVGGCVVGPDYQAPASPVGGAFMGGALLAGRAPAPPAAADASMWWKGFGDPVLDGLVERALAQNLDLAQAQARLDQVRAGLADAEAALLPSGEMEARAARARISTETPTGRLLAASPGFDRDGALHEANLVVGWELDLFGGLRREREAALADYQGARAGVAAARLSVAAQTADAYLVIRGLQARLAVAREQVEARGRLVGTLRLLHDQGAAPELELNRAEGALAQARGAVLVLEERRDASMNALDVLLGVQPGASRAELARPASPPRSPTIAQAVGPADLLRRRPDLVVAERRLRVANAAIGVATAGYYPRASLAGLFGAATTGGDLSSGGAGQVQGVAGVRWRLFDFGRVDAEIAAAKGRRAEALAAYRLSVLRACADVEDAFASLARREEEARVLAEGERALAKARQASDRAFSAGAVSLVELLDADERLLAVRDARVRADTQAARAAVDAFKALGGGWSDEGASGDRRTVATAGAAGGR